MSEDGRRPFAFCCPYCGTNMTAYMTGFGLTRRTQPWEIQATFETEHDCVTGQR